MRILKRGLQKDASGFVRLLCEEEEDMWHVYNLVRVGDIVRSSTMRKVTNESSTGSKTSQRVQITLTIMIETIHFDATVCTLHLKGKNVREHQHVKLGAYHTLDLELNRAFTLEKPCWDAMDLHRLDLCADIANKADVAGIVMHEGLANICLISASMTVVKSKIDMQIARKRKGLTSHHDKSLNQFFSAIAFSFLRHVNLEVIKCVIVASPGFLREQFMDYFWQHVEKEGLRQQLSPHKSKFVLAHSSSGFKHALKEVLSDCVVSQRLSDTKAQSEVKALNTFLELMSTDPQRAVYGHKHVVHAREQQAIETLMISDALFRSRDIGQRRKYVHLVESVKDQGANVLIFSSMHVTGEQLTQLTGVAAILRFPIGDLDDEEWEEEGESEEQSQQNGEGNGTGKSEK